jgi:hypothetical protein
VGITDASHQEIQIRSDSNVKCGMCATIYPKLKQQSITRDQGCEISLSKRIFTKKLKNWHKLY